MSEKLPVPGAVRAIAPVNSAFTAAEALTRAPGAAAGAGLGPGNLFGAAAKGAGLTGTAGSALTALGPGASLLGGGVNVHQGVSSMANDGVGVRNSLQTTSGVAGVVGGAGGLAAMGAFGTGATTGGLAAAGPYGAAAAAGIGFGLRGDKFIHDHISTGGVSGMTQAAGDTTSGWAEALPGGKFGGKLNPGRIAAGMLGSGYGAVGGSVLAVGTGALGFGEDVVDFAGSWFD